MRSAIIAMLTSVLSCAAGAGDISYRFLWQGGGGYSLRGAMSFPAELSGAAVIYETDLSCFEIEGLKDGQPIGRWALAMLEPETTWTLTFDVRASAFVVYGVGANMPQAWNMDGWGNNCGDGGFGFNIGNAAQDICVDGQLIVESQVAPSQPLPAIGDGAVTFSQDACRPELLLGFAQGRGH